MKPAPNNSIRSLVLDQHLAPLECCAAEERVAVPGGKEGQ